MKANEMKCRKCARDANQCASYLRRVNAKGAVPAIWECASPCESRPMSSADKIVAAIIGQTEPPSVSEHSSSDAPPLPRLQLRWQIDETNKRSRGTRQWACYYEMVLRVKSTDIRATHPDLGFLVIPMSAGPTIRSTDRMPCRQPVGSENEGEPFADAPFRDGAHALWDAEQLGLPVVVIDHLGTWFEFKER